MQVNLVSSHNCQFFVDSWIHVFRWKGTKWIRQHWYWKVSDVIMSIVIRKNFDYFYIIYYSKNRRSEDQRGSTGVSLCWIRPLHLLQFKQNTAKQNFIFQKKNTANDVEIDFDSIEEIQILLAQFPMIS